MEGMGEEVGTGLGKEWPWGLGGEAWLSPHLSAAPTRTCPPRPGTGDPGLSGTFQLLPDEGLELRILPHASSRGHCAVQREQSEPVVVRVCVVPKAPSVHTHMRLVPRLEAVPERLQQRSDNHILQPRLWGGGSPSSPDRGSPRAPTLLCLWLAPWPSYGVVG